MDTPYLRVEDTGTVFELQHEVTTVGRGDGVDVALEDPSVSRLHAELVRRGPHVYIADLGLSSNGTRVNGRPVGRRILSDGDVVSFGAARARVGGLAASEQAASDTLELRRVAAPDLTRREVEVLHALCRPALNHEAFVAPATAKDVADELVVTEAAVKQHLLRLYSKFRIAEGGNRRNRLANEVIALGIVRPQPGDSNGGGGNGGPGQASPGQGASSQGATSNSQNAGGQNGGASQGPARPGAGGNPVRRAG